MPIYEYYCTECGKTFEKLHKTGDEKNNLHCPNCKTDDVKRVLSSFSSLFSSCDNSCNIGNSSGKRSGFT